ncbi:MAG: DUF1441 family protein [Acidobacteria bacterium]|jgi:hypothetical protein|nr:DUF1441 family protein [Acidobacteriota bacterium]
MIADLDALSARAVAGDGRGGKRPNSGRRKKDGSPNATSKQLTSPVEVRTVEQLLAEGPPPPMITVGEDGGGKSGDMGSLAFVLPDNPAALYAGAKARKEVALAAKAELDFRIKSGEYLPRDAFRSAVAKVFQSVAQSLRSIPDNLERKLGVDPTLAESVGVSIDETMGDLADELEKIFTKSNELSSAD